MNKSSSSISLNHKVLSIAFNLKMRKFSLLVGIIVIFLLNAVASIYSYHPNDVKPSDSASTMTGAGEFLAKTTKIRDGNQLIGSLDNVEFENVLTKNKYEPAVYQPSACQLVQIVHLLNHPGCQPKAISSFACSGSCTSYVKVSVTVMDLYDKNMTDNGI